MPDKNSRKGSGEDRRRPLNESGRGNEGIEKRRHSNDSATTRVTSSGPIKRPRG